MLIRACNGPLDGQSLWRKGIVAVAIVKFLRVLKVGLQDVILRLTKEVIASVLDATGRLHIATHNLAQPGKIVVRKRLGHRPAVEVVNVHIENLEDGFVGS